MIAKLFHLKPLLLFFAFVFTSMVSYSQGLITEKCKAKDVELHVLSGEFPENRVVAHAGTFINDNAKEVSDLSENDLKHIRKWARNFKSCTVYIDFTRSFFDRKLNPNITDQHLPFLVVRERETK